MGLTRDVNVPAVLVCITIYILIGYNICKYNHYLALYDIFIQAQIKNLNRQPTHGHMTYPLKNVNFVGGFTKKNFGKAQNFFFTPTRFREEARDF